MSEAFYKLVRLIGSEVFRVASAPRILHAERARQAGAYLLAANHQSPYDAPLLIATTPRVIYWLSIAEIFRNPLARWFLRGIGAEPLDRGQVDTRIVRVIVRHLCAGRVVGIFPEGEVREDEGSVLHGGAIHDGICKLAQLAGVPVLPCVVVGSEKFAHWKNWLPGARTRWAVAYGEPVYPCEDAARIPARAAMVEKITHALRALHAEVADYV
jgi:1-acyl-sn-glycerol-3-phosphate acyltransferase